MYFDSNVINNHLRLEIRVCRESLTLNAYLLNLSCQVSLKIHVLSGDYSLKSALNYLLKRFCELKKNL